MKFFNDKLVKIIKEKEITKAFIYRKLKVSRPTFWNWEKGNSIPREDKVRKLAKLLNINVGEISDLKEKEIDDHIFDKITENRVGNNWLKQTHASYEERIRDKNSIIDKINKTYSELAESKLVISTLLNNMDIIFYIKNHNNKYITANNNFIETMKLNKNYNVNGKTDFDLMNSTDAKRNSGEDSSIINNRKKTVCEGFIPNTRKKKWSIIIKTPIFNNDGDVYGLAATYMDITERKKESEFRKLLEEKLKVLDASINQVNLVVSILEGENYLDHTENYYISGSVEKLFGYTKEEFYTDNYLLRKKIMDKDYTQSYVDWLTEKRYSEKFRYKIRTKSGEEKWCESRANELIYQSRKCIVIRTLDITDRVAIEKEQENTILEIALKLHKRGIDTDTIIEVTGLPEDTLQNYLQFKTKNKTVDNF